jgi:hypothetical protein
MAIFEFDIRAGHVLPKQIKYWEPAPDGTIRVRVLGH